MEQLKKLVPVLESDYGYFFNDPNGVRIYLVEGEESGFDLPESVDNLTGNFAADVYYGVTSRIGPAQNAICWPRFSRQMTPTAQAGWRRRQISLLKQSQQQH